MLELPGLEERHRTHILDNIMTLMNIIQDKEILMEDMYNHKRKAPSVVSELLSGATAKHAPSSAVHATVEIANAAVGNRNIAVGNRNDSGSSDSPTAFKNSERTLDILAKRFQSMAPSLFFLQCSNF